MEPVPLTVGGAARRYLLARPPDSVGVNPTARRPVVVFLHGTGGTAGWAADETGWSGAAAREGFLLALPDGLPPDPAKPPKFLTNPPRWNDGATRPGDPVHTDADDVGFLAAVVADLVGRGADPRRVYLTGFSNGAGMAFRFAAERADLVAAVAPVAGYCWVDPRPARPVPTLYLVGTADPLIPVAGGQVRLPWGGRAVRRPAVAETLGRWAAANGCGPAPATAADAGGVREEVYPPGPGGAEVRAVYVHGLGHHWPGGKGGLGPRLGGPAASPVDANELIWQFFRRHS